MVNWHRFVPKRLHSLFGISSEEQAVQHKQPKTGESVSSSGERIGKFPSQSSPAAKQVQLSKLPPDYEMRLKPELKRKKQELLNARRKNKFAGLTDEELIHAAANPAYILEVAKLKGVPLTVVILNFKRTVAQRVGELTVNSRENPGNTELIAYLTRLEEAKQNIDAVGS